MSGNLESQRMDDMSDALQQRDEKINRLERELAELQALFGTPDRQQIAKLARNAAIEEAAKVAESFVSYEEDLPNKTSAAIRALVKP